MVAARLAGFRARQVRQVGYRWLLPVAVGVAGVTVTVAYHQLVSGSISDWEFLHISASPAVLVTFTGVGALIGGVGVSRDWCNSGSGDGRHTCYTVST